tara:strand:- start:783 stop:959 length:177 start_codon:yes stop_codon:yes gene_type:complete
MDKINNPIITLFRLIVNLVTAWMVVEAGHSLDNIYISLAGWTLLVGWILGFVERYDSK